MYTSLSNCEPLPSDHQSKEFFWIPSWSCTSKWTQQPQTPPAPLARQESMPFDRDWPSQSNHELVTSTKVTCYIAKNWSDCLMNLQIVQRAATLYIQYRVLNKSLPSALYSEVVPCPIWDPVLRPNAKLNNNFSQMIKTKHTISRHATRQDWEHNHAECVYFYAFGCT